MSNQNSDPTQQQLIDARRNQILDAAITVFAEKGFHKATIKDIAKVAKIADGTIYNYFANKTALVLGILDRLNETDQREEHFDLSTEMDLRAFFRMYVQRRFAYLDPNGYAMFQVLIPEILTNNELRETYYRQVIEPTFQKVEPFYQIWIDRGDLKPFDIPLMTAAISSMFLGLIMLRLIGDEYLISQWDQLPDLITNIVLDGIAQGKPHGD
jgi:AcrR family transcriptional regulator